MSSLWSFIGVYLFIPFLIAFKFSKWVQIISIHTSFSHNSFRLPVGRDYVYVGVSPFCIVLLLEATQIIFAYLLIPFLIPSDSLSVGITCSLEYLLSFRCYFLKLHRSYSCTSSSKFPIVFPMASSAHLLFVTFSISCKSLLFLLYRLPSTIENYPFSFCPLQIRNSTTHSFFGYRLTFL